MLHPPSFPDDTTSATTQAHTRKRLSEDPPQKPDWLLIFISVLFLLTLLLIWLVDIPQTMQ